MLPFFSYPMVLNPMLVRAFKICCSLDRDCKIYKLNTDLLVMNTYEHIARKP